MCFSNSKCDTSFNFDYFNIESEICRRKTNRKCSHLKMDRTEPSYLLLQLRHRYRPNLKQSLQQARNCRECAFGSGPSLQLNHVQYLLYAMSNVKYFLVWSTTDTVFFHFWWTVLLKRDAIFLGIILGHLTCKEGSVLSEASAPVPLSMQKAYRNEFFSYIVLQRKKPAL